MTAESSDRWQHALATKRFLNAVDVEVRRATVLHSPYNSLHEAYAVILEEVDELWDEVRKQRHARSSDIIRTELIQIAATACRAAFDLGLVNGD
jgi:hypothetical protein